MTVLRTPDERFTRLEGFPFQPHYAEHEDEELGVLRIHYLDEGPRDGPPVLMLHGNPTWSFYYRNLVMALRGAHRCIVPDHIGCGLSDKPGDDVYDYRLRSRVEDIGALVDHLGLSQPLTLVVHDWGGMIGFAWAVENPEHVAQTVIMNTAAFPLPAAKKMPPALSLARDTAVGAFLVRRFNAFSGIAARVAFKKPVSAEVRAAYTLPYDSPANRIATLRFVQDIPLTDQDIGYDILLNTAKQLHLLADKPCLIAWGEKDFVFDEPFLDTWLESLPEAEVLRFPDCGHYILEDGGPDLIRQIANFIGIRDDSNNGQDRG